MARKPKPSSDLTLEDVIGLFGPDVVNTPLVTGVKLKPSQRGKAPGKPRLTKPKAAPAPVAAPAPPSPAPTPAPRAPAAAPAEGVARRLAMLKNVTPMKAGLGALALGGLGALVARGLRTPPNRGKVDEAVSLALSESQGQQVAQLLERQRMERAIRENQLRLARANPTLYTSVMAGRRVPSGAVVLGGQPRMDLMRELAASMDSGAFQKRDPLSDLMG